MRNLFILFLLLCAFASRSQSFDINLDYQLKEFPPNFLISAEISDLGKPDTMRFREYTLINLVTDTLGSTTFSLIDTSGVLIIAGKFKGEDKLVEVLVEDIDEFGEIEVGHNFRARKPTPHGPWRVNPDYFNWLRSAKD